MIAELASRFPQSSEVLSKYLTDQAPLRVLGYFQRVSESAEQYAVRLLAGKILAASQTPASIAKHLVHHYKDHGFVIDFDEAITLLGSDIVKIETDQYRLSDEVFKFIDGISMYLSMHKKNIWIVGDVTDENSVGIRAKRDG